MVFPWSQLIATFYIPFFPCLALHTSRRRGSRQGEGQLRGDFNLSEKIHIKPLMPPFHHPSPFCLPCLPCSFPGTHHSSLPLLPSSSCHLIQITELASVFFVFASILPGRWTGQKNMDSDRGDSVCLWNGWRKRKGGEQQKLLGGKMSNSNGVWRLSSVKCGWGLGFQATEWQGYS